jgi:hypothetical protein
VLAAAEPGVYRIGHEQLSAAGVAGDAAAVGVRVNGVDVPAFVTAASGALGAGDSVLVYVAGGPATIELTQGVNPLRMQEVDAAPVNDGRDVWYGVAAGDRLELPLGQAYGRHVLLGFSAEPVVVLDVTDPARPAILYGYAVTEVDGEVVVYLSYGAEGAGKAVAVGAGALQEPAPAGGE